MMEQSEVSQCRLLYRKWNRWNKTVYTVACVDWNDWKWRMDALE